MCTKNLSLEQLVSAYITIRDKKAQLKAEHAEKEKPLNDALYRLEQEVLSRLNEQGVESTKTAAGTAYRSVRSTVSVADKSAFLHYIVSQTKERLEAGEDPTPAFDMLDLKANKTFVEDYLAREQDLPPGVNMRREEVVGFRRA